MKMRFLSCIATAVLVCSCGNGKQGRDSGQAGNDSIPAATEIAPDGQWNIENVVVNDSVSVRPADETPGRPSWVKFENGNYSVMTNCNSIQGSYTLKGDSIAMNAGLCTEMACDNMKVEELVKQVLPEICTVEMVNDSIMRLNGTGSGYIVLSRIVEPVK